VKRRDAFGTARWRLVISAGEDQARRLCSIYGSVAARLLDKWAIH
jgi:hypothetical protein